MAEPRIYSRNWIDGLTSFTLSHGGATSYLYDRSDTPVYTTTGAASDSTTASIYLYFYDAGYPIYRTIDTIFLKNYNWKEWSVNYWNGSSWVALASQTTDTESNRYISISNNSLDRIRIDIVKTKTPNQEKSIGEIVLCNVTLATDDLSSYDTKWREKRRRSYWVTVRSTESSHGRCPVEMGAMRPGAVGPTYQRPCGTILRH
jgi:hypothetical protein